MRLISAVVAASLAAITLNAAQNPADMRALAKDVGFMAIPSDANQLEKLIKEYAPDYEAYPTTKERSELGKMLYFDPRLSKSGIISCNTCHNLGYGGSDNIPASTGHKWSPNPHHINSPTVLNSVFNSVQFWDGRAAHLAAQAAGPLTAPVEMASTPERAAEVVNSIPEYVELFKKAYSDDVKIDFDLITTTIGIYERNLVTPSRFDAFLEGDDKALSSEELDGMKLFIDKGCTMCHTGINLGGTMQAFELVNKFEFANVGDFKGDENGLVKTPVLRNVTLTTPYFHNGTIWKLTDAIKTMGSVQLGIDINDKDAKSIEAFFKSLEGKLPDVIYPMLPASTDATPKPELDY